jgi:DeoR family transcriptional regulator of aga operon
MTTERHSDLLLLLLAKGKTSVQDIAAALGASPATVRRDLIELEVMGRVERSHGAARIATGSQKELAFSAREHDQIDAKRAIALEAAQYIQPNETLFLDAGTTVLQLARHIRGIAMPVKVFTNGLAVAQELAHVAGIETTLIGGRVRPENLSMVGPAAIAMIEGLWFNRLFLGATAIDCDGWLTSLDAAEAQINAQMVRRSASVTVMADGSKFRQRVTYGVTRLSKGQRLISDVHPTGALAKNLLRLGVNFTLAKVELGAKAADA